MKTISITITSHSNCATIQLKHNDDFVIEAQEFNRVKIPAKGILKAIYKLIKLKIKRRKIK